MHHFPGGVSRKRDTQPVEAEARSANGWQPLETFHQVLPPSPQMRKKLTCGSSSWYQGNSCGRTATMHTLWAAGKNSHITPKVRTVESKMGNRADLHPVAWIRV